MTEEKAPSPLPDVLPTGTEWRGINNPYVWRLTAPSAAFDGHSWIPSSTWERIRPDHADCSGSAKSRGSVTIRPEDVAWPSYYAALRSPPSPPSEGPRVGEKWLAAVWTDGVMTKERPVTITRLGETCADIEGGENYSARLPGHYLNRNWCLVRRLSAPSADKWEPRLGQEVEGFHEHSGATVRGTYGGPDVFKSPLRNGQPAALIIMPGNTTGGWLVPPETVRPATPSPKAEEATLPPCQHRNVNLYTMRCDDCGMTAAQVRAKAEKVAERVDPYKEHRLSLEYGSAVEFSNVPTLDQRIAAAKAQHLADFDRPLATVAVGGRFGKRVGLVNENWPSQEGED